MAKRYGVKRYSKENTTKKAKVARGEVGRGPMTEKRKREKKLYADKFSDTQRAKAKKAMTSDKAYGVSFKSAFADARGAGKSKFTWQGKSYHTKTKSELEGAKEKEKFARAGKSKEKGKKQSIWKKFASSKTGAEFVRKLKA